MESQSFDRWLSRVGDKTKRTYRNTFNRFMKWLKENGGKFSEMSPDELIEYQKNCDNGSCYEILDLIQDYILSMEGQRYKTKTRTYSTIKSFFTHNRAPLPDDPSFKIRSEKEPVRGDLTVEEIRDVVLSSKKMYRAIFLSMFQGALDLSGFDQWNRTGWASLNDQIRSNPDMIRIDISGRKTGKNTRSYYTFIGRDAIKAIRDYIQVRPEASEGIFVTAKGKPIGISALRKYWMQHLDKLGIIDLSEGKVKGTSVRYGKNLHELRDLFRSQWEKSPAKASVAEFMMGHIIDPLGYNKAHRDESWVRGELRKALPMLQIMSSSSPFGMVDKDEVERLRAEIARLQTTRDNEFDELQKRIEAMEDYLRERESPTIKEEMEDHIILREMEKRGASYEELEAEAYSEKPREDAADNRTGHGPTWNLKKDKKKF